MFRKPTTFRGLAAPMTAAIALLALSGCHYMPWHKKAPAKPMATKPVHSGKPMVAEPIYNGGAAPVGDYVATTEAVGEEDGGVYDTTTGGTVTTLAVGEEDGGAIYESSSGGGVATTLAIGEEDGGVIYDQPIPVEPDGGIGDGAGPIPGTVYDSGPVYTAPTYDSSGGTVTTLAIGEEDGGRPMPVEPDGGIGDGAGPIPEYNTVTTLAIGEEDGGMPMPVEPDGGIGDGAGPLPGTGYDAGPIYTPPTYDSSGGTVTTLAIGEESGGATY